MTFSLQTVSYKRLNDLDYPVNVLRNAARTAATTKYVLVSGEREQGGTSRGTRWAPIL